jgi:PAS domain S-box-containing protein
MEITAADGNQLSFWCTGSVAAWHKDGRPKMVVECLRNITEPKRGEETLRESENNYRTLLENLPQKIFHKDKDSVYVSCNENYARDLKIRPEEIKAKTDYEFFPKELAEKYRADDRKIMTSGEIEDIEEKYVQDGRQMWVQTVKTPLKDENGNTSGILGIFWDITETKQAEEERMRLEAQLQQAHKMEAIGTLAGGIAHDFNNILSAIIGYAELAREDVPEGSKVQANLREVYKAGIRAKDLVQQILAFSRQSEQEQKPLRISPIIKESLKLLRASLPSTIDIRQNMGSKWDTIMAEPTQIHEVLMNLCANAGHAMREHGGVMELSLEDVDLDSRAASQSLGLRPGPYVRLTVSDTGCGIAPEILGRIFDPYFTTKEPGEGTGMGMAIVHGIVKSHGGAITVNSEPGKGTTFQVFFPSIESEQEDEVKAVKPLPTGSERVLFVDDEKALVDIGKQMLERLGYQVVARTSSIEALEAFRAQPDKFDLVITDQTMPNMTGEKLVEELMGIRLDIPIILCTGYSQMISEDKAKALGIREFVMKPIVMHDIAETIRRALDA